MVTNNNFTIHVTERTHYAYQSARILDQIITKYPTWPLMLQHNLKWAAATTTLCHAKLQPLWRSDLQIPIHDMFGIIRKGISPNEGWSFENWLEWMHLARRYKYSGISVEWNIHKNSEKCIPHRLVTIRSKDKPWYHSSQRNLKRKLERLHRKTKFTNVSTYWSKYGTACNGYWQNSFLEWSQTGYTYPRYQLVEMCFIIQKIRPMHSITSFSIT